MKRHIFSWQKTLQQLGRGVIWQNKLLHRSRNGKQPEYQTQRRPTWESLEPRHLLAGIGFQLVTQQAKVHEHSGALISSSSPSSLIGEKGPWKEGELVMQADGEGSSSFLPPNRISITSAETLLSFDGVTTLTQNAVGESVLTSNGVVFGNDPERNGVALLNGSALNFDVENRLLLTGDWTLFTRFKELNLSGSVLTLFAGETDSQLVINSSSKELGYYDSDGGNGFVGIGYFATNLLDNQWHDVAVVRSNGVLSYFVDGLIVGTVADSNSTYLQWLGGKTGNDSFSRSIDDFRYFHRALSATEIAAVSRDDEAIPIHPAYYDNSPYFLNAIGHSHNQEVQLTYSLLDDANGRFAIHPTGGAITIPNRSDPVFVGSHTIAIQVTDREGVSSVRRITIQIVPFHPQAGSMFVSQVFLAAGGDTTVGPLAGFTLPLPLTAYQSDWIAAPELSDRLIPVYSTTNPSVIERVIVNGPLTSAHVGKMALVRHWYESIDGGETRITETEFHIVPTLEPPSLAPNVTLFEPRFDSSKR